MGGHHTTDGADDNTWDTNLDNESASVMKAVGRQLKLWREDAGLKQAELGAALGYSEEMVSAVERGRRLPKPELLRKADEVLCAGGKILAMERDVVEARYPRKVRDLARLEAEAVELGSYGNHNVHGLLQTEEYARALFAMRRPVYGEAEVERHVSARMARRIVFDRTPPPTLSFVMEEVTLRRPLGGKAVLRRQLRHLLELAELRHVELQVMPTDREDHAGMGGQIQVLQLTDGSALGYSEAQLSSRLVSDPREIQILELRYGILRAQALTPVESLTFIHKALGET